MKPNGYHYPQLAKKLLIDAKLLPMSTCIMAKHFKRDPIPATSTYVESDTNDIKTRLMRKGGKVRIDEFVPLHVGHINGNCKLQFADRDRLREKDPIPNNRYPTADILDKAQDVLSEQDTHWQRDFDEIYNDIPQEDIDVNEVAQMDSQSVNESLHFVTFEPTQHSSIQQSTVSLSISTLEEVDVIQPVLTDCPACKNQHFATDAHRCVKCKKNVHIFLECSQPITSDEQGKEQGKQGKNRRKIGNNKQQTRKEGYGEPRICNECYLSTKKLVEVAQSNKQDENWGGQITNEKPQKKDARWLKRTFSEADFAEKKRPTSIVLQNSSSEKLKTITVGQKKYSITNSDKFDSIFHMFLKIAHESHDSKNYMQEIDTEMFSLVDYVMKKSLNKHVYKVRAEILIEIAKMGDITLKGQIRVLTCSSSPSEMINYFLESQPCVEKHTMCENGCHTMNKTSTVGVTIENLLSGNLDEVINNSWYPLTAEVCSNCAGKVSQKLKINGKI